MVTGRWWPPTGAAPSIEVALTFDDGPHPEHTPELLDALKRRGLTATFFLIGENAARHPEIVRRIAAEGHELGNHTYTHGRPECTSARALSAEVRRAKALIEDITGTACALFRPPWGKLTARKLLALWRDCQTVVLWNAGPHSKAELTHERMLGWCARYAPSSGDIILMHDDQPHAASAVAALAERAAAESIRFVSISKYLA